MAALRPNALLISGYLACIAPFAWAQSPATQSAEIVLDAASSEMDYRTNTLLFQDLLITQGSTRVKAERARSTGLDFAGP